MSSIIFQGSTATHLRSGRIVGTLSVNGEAVTFGTATQREEGPWLAAAPPNPFLAVPNVTAHPSTASVPITVLLYDGPLRSDFDVAIKWLMITLLHNFIAESAVQ